MNWSGVSDARHASEFLARCQSKMPAHRRIAEGRLSVSGKLSLTPGFRPVRKKQGVHSRLNDLAQCQRVDNS
jgi:hypothetical protein